MTWPLERVTLIDGAAHPVDDWIGYLVPRYLGGIPNLSAAVCFTLEYECGARWLLGPGDLGHVVWSALEAHERWCLAPPAGQVGKLPTLN